MRFAKTILQGYSLQIQAKASPKLKFIGFKQNIGYFVSPQATNHGG